MPPRSCDHFEIVIRCRDFSIKSGSFSIIHFPNSLPQCTLIDELLWNERKWRTVSIATRMMAFPWWIKNDGRHFCLKFKFHHPKSKIIENHPITMMITHCRLRFNDKRPPIATIPHCNVMYNSKRKMIG